MVFFNAENQSVNNKKLPELNIVKKKGTEISDATSDEFILDRDDVVITLIGRDFKYNDNKNGTLKVKNGQINKIEVEVDNEPVYQINTLKLSVTKFIDKINEGKLTQLIKNNIFNKKDKIEGSFLDDKLFGFDGKDKIKGWGGDDKINGGLGNDKLIGYTGDDIFAFNTELNSKKNVDRITDFNRKKDSFQLDKDIFSGFKKGELSKDSFIKGKPEDEDPVIEYKKSNGAIFYDPDGSGDEKKIKFAKIDKKEGLSHDDFFVV